MKKLFISQPMNGLSDKEILEKRTEIMMNVVEKTGENVKLIDSFFQDSPHDAKPLWFLGKSLELLSTADFVYFADNWKDYRGCKIEHECAVQYGLTIVND